MVQKRMVLLEAVQVRAFRTLEAAECIISGILLEFGEDLRCRRVCFLLVARACIASHIGFDLEHKFVPLIAVDVG